MSWGRRLERGGHQNPSLLKQPRGDGGCEWARWARARCRDGSRGAIGPAVNRPALQSELLGCEQKPLRPRVRGKGPAGGGKGSHACRLPFCRDRVLPWRCGTTACWSVTAAVSTETCLSQVRNVVFQVIGPDFTGLSNSRIDRVMAGGTHSVRALIRVTFVRLLSTWRTAGLRAAPQAGHEALAAPGSDARCQHRPPL